jgi:hypothetical protein
LRIFTAFFFIVTIFFYLLSCNVLKASNLGTIIGLLLLALSWLPVDSVRPRVISYAFLAILWSILLFNPKAAKHQLLLVAVLFIVWVQIHGGVVYGALLVLGWSLGRLIDNRISGRHLVSSDVVGFLGASMFGLVGFLIHPQGFSAFEHLLFYPIRLGSHLGEITELSPPVFGTYVWTLIVIMTLSLFPICFKLAKEKRWAHAIPLIMFAVFSFKMARGLPSLAVLLSPFIASCIGGWLKSFDKYLVWFKPTFALLAVLLLLAWANLIFQSRPISVNRPLPIEHSLIDRARFPVDAALFVRSNFAGKKIFNYYRHGGFLNWSFFMVNLTYIDGRGDHHERAGIYSNYLDIVDLKPGWEKKLQMTGADLILFPRAHPFTAAVQKSGSWAPIYSDNYDMVFALNSEFIALSLQRFAGFVDIQEEQD